MSSMTSSRFFLSITAPRHCTICIGTYGFKQQPRLFMWATARTSGCMHRQQRRCPYRPMYHGAPPSCVVGSGFAFSARALLAHRPSMEDIMQLLTTSAPHSGQTCQWMTGMNHSYSILQQNKEWQQTWNNHEVRSSKMILAWRQAAM